MRRLFIWCPHHFLFSGEGGPFSTSARNGRGVGQGRGIIFCYKKRGWKERRRSDRGERFRRRRRHFGKVKEVANEGSLPPPRRRRFRKVNNFACRATKRKREGERAETRRRRRRLESGDATFGPSLLLLYVGEAARWLENGGSKCAPIFLFLLAYPRHRRQMND